MEPRPRRYLPRWIPTVSARRSKTRWTGWGSTFPSLFLLSFLDTVQPLIHLDPFDQAELHHNAHLLLFEYRISERWSPTCYNLVYDTRGGKSYRMEYTGYMGVNNLGNKIKNKIILKRFDGKEEDRYDFFYGCIFLLNVSKNILI